MNTLVVNEYVLGEKCSLECTVDRKTNKDFCQDALLFNLKGHNSLVSLDLTKDIPRSYSVTFFLQPLYNGAFCHGR